MIMKATAPPSHLVMRVIDLRQAWKALKAAKEERCTCTGFVIQYQGCSCGRAKKIQELQDTVNQLTEEL